MSPVCCVVAVLTLVIVLSFVVCFFCLLSGVGVVVWDEQGGGVAYLY